MNKNLIWLLFLMTLSWFAAAPRPALALTVHTTKAELCAKANVVAIGKVTNRVSTWQQRPGGSKVIVSTITMSVERLLHGNVANTFTFQLPSGTVDGITHIQDGVQVMEPGDRYFVLLYASPNQPLKVLAGGLGAVHLDADAALQPLADLVSLYQSNCNAG